MQTAAKWTFGFGLLFAAGALAMAFVVAARQPKLPQPLTLPSGETLILRGVSYGTNHFAPGKPLWWRLLPAPVRLAWLSRFFGPGNQLFNDRTTPDPRLLLWLEIQANAATNRTWATNVWMMLQDEQGRAAGKREEVSLWGSNPGRGQVAEFRVFPRRGAQIGVIFIQGSWEKPSIVGHWQIPNPVRNTTRSWETESLPVTRTNGNLECTLGALSAKTGNSSGQIAEKGGWMRFDFKPAKAGEEPGAAFPATFRERGIETNTWTIGSIALSDATGNVLPSSGTGWSRSSNTVIFHWNPVLWPEEGWELQLLAKRTPEAKFLPEEVAEFKDVVVPGFDTPVNLGREITVNGVTLRTREFVLHTRPDPDAWSSSQVSQLKLIVTGLTNGLSLDLIRAADEQERIFRCDGWSTSGGSGAPLEFSFFFRDLTNEVKRLDFTLAVQRGVPFTFRLTPEWISTNASFRMKR